MDAPHPRRITTAALILFLLISYARTACAHPMIENGLDVVIRPDRITIDARISPEQVILVEARGTTRPAAGQWPQLLQNHREYLRNHLRVKVDNRTATAASVESLTSKLQEAGSTPSSSSLIAYRLEYRLPTPPGVVQIDHSFLREFDTWSASCVLRIRQVNDAAFDTALLTREKTAEFNCVWPPSTTGPIDEASSDSIQTNVRIWPTIRAYTAHGIMHILTGYDHLLFVSALVLAAVSLWDLIKVVSAFTLAHTLTLTLSVFNIVTLGERVVEPMIAASIVFVAVQNIFWPERSRGWTRLAIAFAFGLFHGLGFAGGLKEAMSQMPPVALWAALAAFSLGVEIGHQVVVIPLFTVLYTVRHWKAADPGPRLVVVGRLRMVCSAAISVAGCYFLVHAIW